MESNWTYNIYMTTTLYKSKTRNVIKKDFQSNK
jgi:hypothetical protein